MIHKIFISLLFVLWILLSNVVAQPAIMVDAKNTGIQKLGSNEVQCKVKLTVKDTSWLSYAWSEQHFSSIATNQLNPADFSSLPDSSFAGDAFVLSYDWNHSTPTPITLIVYDALSGAFARIPVPYHFMISELDVDTPGSDTQEFAEMIAPGFPNAPLHGIELIAINGSNESVSRRFSLDEEGLSADENGLFAVIGRNLELPNIDEQHIFRSSTNLFQNGNSSFDESDAVAIMWDIPDLDQQIVLDAIIYNVDRASQDLELAEMLEMNPSAVVEGFHLDKEQSSLQRYFSSFGQLKDAGMYHEQSPSPMELNTLPVQGVAGQNRWLMLTVPKNISALKWVNPTFLTQGSPLADIPEGTSLFFKWEDQAFHSFSSQETPFSESNAYFFYASDQTYGMGDEGWPKRLGVWSEYHHSALYESQSVALEGAGYSLVANPFPFPIAVDSLINSFPTIDEVALWVGKEQQYQIRNEAGGDWMNAIVPPFGAFWIKHNNAISFDLNAHWRASLNDPQAFFKQGRGNSEQLVISAAGSSGKQSVIIQLSSQQNRIVGQSPYRLPPSNHPWHFFIDLNQRNWKAVKLANEHEAFELQLKLEVSNSENADVEIWIDEQLSNLDLEHWQLFLKIDDERFEWHPFKRLDAQKLINKSLSLHMLPRKATSLGVTTELPEYSQLHAAYPNPFNPQTTLRYALAQPSYVRMNIMNAAGALVRSMDLGYQRAGMHSAAFMAESNLPSGVYIVQLVLNGQPFQSTKITLIK